MKRLLMTGLAMMLLTGCADLQMIKNAAMNELQSEAISVEMAAYKQNTIVLEPEETVTQAPATIKPQAEGLIRLAMAPKTVIASRHQKGLWESQ
jgi:hypothetical protein